MRIPKAPYIHSWNDYFILSAHFNIQSMTTHGFDFKREVLSKEMVDLAPDSFIPLASKEGYHVFNSKYSDLLYLFDRSSLKVVELEAKVDVSEEAHLNSLVQAYQEHVFSAKA